MFRNVEISSPSPKKIRNLFWKKKFKNLMKYLHITCVGTLRGFFFFFFLCGVEGEFSGQGFFWGRAGSERGGRAVCFLTLGWWAGVVALPLHLSSLSLARSLRQILLSFSSVQNICSRDLIELKSKRTNAVSDQIRVTV